MNEFEVMVQQYWQENQSTQRTTCPSAALSTTHPYMDWLWIKPKPPQWDAAD